MKPKVLFIVFLFPFINSTIAQTNYPVGYFASPINIALQLNGNFGAIRPARFHTGFDRCTDGPEARPGLAPLAGSIYCWRARFGGLYGQKEVQHASYSKCHKS